MCVCAFCVFAHTYASFGQKLAFECALLNRLFTTESKNF